MPLAAKSPPTNESSRPAVWLAAGGLGCALLVAYHNSFAGPFVFDDAPAILGNPSIHDLSDLAAVLAPPSDDGQTVGGRPIVNLTLALNYALGGAEPRGYHIVNFLIHLLATLTLFGLARRTLELWRGARSDPAVRLGASPVTLAAVIAGAWGVHPLLTESVTYIVQRAESLVGLFYLLTLYAFVRGVAEPPAKRGWLIASWVACLLGMATKEVMVSAPLLVLLYDRTFVAGSWREAGRQRGKFHAALASTWLLLGWLVLSAGNRGGTAGLGAGDSVWDYALIQCRAIVHYLRLAVWPHPLSFDYGMQLHTTWQAALPFALVLAGLVAATVVALRRWPAAGFLGVWFFALLAPSSSVVPIAVQPMAEHRMYLPLVALAVLGAVAVFGWARRRAWLLIAPVLPVFAGLTIARNADYRSALALWQDTVAKQPANARAHSQLGEALRGAGRIEAALAHYAEAVRLETATLRPGARSLLGEYLVNQGGALFALGRHEAANAALSEAVRREPNLTQAHYNLGCVRMEAGEWRAAAESFETTLRLDPGYVAARTNLGAVLLRERRVEEALAQFRQVLQWEPGAPARANLGLALIHAGRFTEAVSELEAVLRVNATFAPAHQYLGDAFAAMGRHAEALKRYERAAALQPDNASVLEAIQRLRGPAPREPRRVP